MEMCARNNCSRRLKGSSSGRVCTFNLLAMFMIFACSFFNLSQMSDPKERPRMGNKSCSSLLKCSSIDCVNVVKGIASLERSPTSIFPAFVFNRAKSRVIALCSFVSRAVSVESLSAPALSASHKHRGCGLNSHGWRSVGVFDRTKDSFTDTIVIPHRIEVAPNEFGVPQELL